MRRLDEQRVKTDFNRMFMALGLAAFRVGWNARIAAMLGETILIGVISLSSLIVDIAPHPIDVLGVEIPARYCLLAMFACELAALFWGRRMHERAAAYDPSVAALYGDDAQNQLANDHHGLQRGIVDDLEAVGARPAPPIESESEVDEAAIAALSAKPADGRDRRA